MLPVASPDDRCDDCGRRRSDLAPNRGLPMAWCTGTNGAPPRYWLCWNCSGTRHAVLNAGSGAFQEFLARPRFGRCKVRCARCARPTPWQRRSPSGRPGRLCRVCERDDERAAATAARSLSAAAVAESVAETERARAHEREHVDTLLARIVDVLRRADTEDAERLVAAVERLACGGAVVPTVCAACLRHPCSCVEDAAEGRA